MKKPSLGSNAFLLAQLGTHAMTKFAARMATLGLAPPHAGALRAVAAQPGLSQQTLAEVLRTLPSRLVVVVDQLESLGLVERRDHPDDRRSYALHLTDKGAATMPEIGKLARAHDEELCAALTSKEREQLGELLARIANEQGLTPGVHPGYRRLDETERKDDPKRSK